MLFRDQQNNQDVQTQIKSRSRKRKETVSLHSMKRNAVTKEAMDTIKIQKNDDTMWTPTSVQKKLEQLIQTSELATPLWVKGELSNFCPRNRSGHMYFDIRDDNSNKLSCTLFGVNYVVAPDIQDRLENGVLVAVKGSIKCISKYRGSQYQCNVRTLKIVCEDTGSYEQQLLEWTTQLQQEGLFDATHKRTLPAYAQQVAVITSQDGAAWQDVRQTIANANVPLQFTLYPCMVQGEKCVSSILIQLETICELGLDDKPDIVLITRGGGSREDLWAFNQPALARGVHAMRSIGQLPHVVCAIGHQVDTPLLDNVCDASFITPTYAAQQLVRPFLDLHTQCSHKHQLLTNRLLDMLHQKHICHTRIHEEIKEYNIYACIQFSHQSMLHRVQQSINTICKKYESVYQHIHQRHHRELLLSRLKQSHQVYPQKIQQHIQHIHQHHYTTHQNITQAMPWCMLVKYPNTCLLQDEKGNQLHINTLKQRKKGHAIIVSGGGTVCIEYRIL